MDEFHPVVTERTPIMKQNDNGGNRVWEAIS